MKPARKNSDEEKQLLIRRAALDEPGSQAALEALARFIASREHGVRPWDLRQTYLGTYKRDVRLPRAPYTPPTERSARIFKLSLLKAEDLVLAEWSKKGMQAEVLHYVEEKFDSSKFDYNRWTPVTALRAWLARVIRKKILTRPIVEAIMKAFDMMIPLAVWSPGGYGLDVPAGEDVVIIYDNWDGAHIWGGSDDSDEGQQHMRADHAQSVEVNSFTDANEPLSWFADQGGHEDLARDMDIEVDEILNIFREPEDGEDIANIANDRAQYFWDVSSRQGAHELSGGSPEHYDWDDYARVFAIELAYEDVGWLR